MYSSCQVINYKQPPTIHLNQIYGKHTHLSIETDIFRKQYKLSKNIRSETKQTEEKIKYSCKYCNMNFSMVKLIK